MDIALWLVALAIVVLSGCAIASRLSLPAPLLLVVVGVAASYLPFIPDVHLHHDVVLLGLLPPLLYAAAIQTSLVDFNANKRPILLLSVGAIIFTTIGIGALVQWMVPGIGWPLALAIGAVVAPPDAVAATAIGRQIGLPRRVVTILEGESLFNDATAIVSLRTALAALGGGVALWEIGRDFAIAAGGGALIGFATFAVVGFLRRRVVDPALDVGISFVVPFAAYLLAEEVHASGVISVVIAGLLLGHKAPVIQTAQSRLAERTNWHTVAFVLENAVFLLIGLQVDWILRDALDGEFTAARIILMCLAVLLGVIVLRLVWVLGTRALLGGQTRDAEGGERPSWGGSVLIGWAGMRGVVTLAAAFLIPEDAAYRPLLLLMAMTVVAGTLFLQGLSLGWLARRLRVPGPDPAEDALARAGLLQQATKAGLERLDTLTEDAGDEACALVRTRMEQRNLAAWERLDTVMDEETPSDAYTRVRLDVLHAERERVLQIRSSGHVDSEIVSGVLGMLDVEESMLDVAASGRERVRRARVEATPDPLQVCADLDRYPAIETVSDPVCQACVEADLRWVALRQCLECGHVGCCDSSAGHATEHFHDTEHPVMESAQPGEAWRWCYIHHLTI